MPDPAYVLSASLLLGLPLLIFFVLYLGGRSLNKISGWIGALATLSGLLTTFFFIDTEAVHQLTFNWLTIGEREIDIALRFDVLAFLMLLIVHFVALLVQVYSVSYMHHDENLHRYFAFIQLFLFSMIGIVLSGSLIVMYIFWELVGLCSYLLISFWYFKKRPVWAAQKAFVLNRIGDAAFLCGILMLFYYVGSTDFATLGTEIQTLDANTLTIIGVLLFGGCVGKSAQFPLSGWLPDAMEGPTPVSALIHAATMVAAGIFLLARIAFMLTAEAQFIILVIGTITMLYGAFRASKSWDIKGVLAYSTISQLGLMVVAVGFGSWQMAFFHLVTHAFFKAGLFLSAGSVIHAVTPAHAGENYDPQDMRLMGGLRKLMPVTFLCFLICATALAGLPFFSGFLSKDAIITAGFAWAGQNGPFALIFPIAAIVGAGFTAFYMLRQVWLIFLSENRFDQNLVYPHESPVIMTAPMTILAALSLFFWYSLNPFGADSWLLSLIEGHPAHIAWVPFAATAVSVIGLALSYRQIKSGNPYGLHSSHTQKDIFDRLAWQRGFSLTEFFVIPFDAAARISGVLDKRIFDAIVNGTAKVSVITAFLIAWFDRMVVDGFVKASVLTVRSAGQTVRSLQSGRIQSYYVVTIAGVFLLILWLVFV